MSGCDRDGTFADREYGLPFLRLNNLHNHLPDLDNLSDHKLRWRLLMASYRAARALRDTHNHPAKPHHKPRPARRGSHTSAAPRTIRARTGTNPRFSAAAKDTRS